MVVTEDVQAVLAAVAGHRLRAGQTNSENIVAPSFSECCYPLSSKRFELVYPQPVIQHCPLPEYDNDSTQGNAQKGQDDFYGLQSYHAGDNIRHIHWRTFAKGQGLFIRQYSGAQSSEIWLDYAQTTGIEQEERLSQMCRWVLDADFAGVSYGFRLAGHVIALNQGKHHSKKCLEALALA